MMKHPYYFQNSLGLYKAFISSHATYNSLAAIQNMIVSDDTREALSNLSKFAKFIRKFSASADQPYHDFMQETELLTSYLELENLRFSEHLNFEIDVEESLSAEKFSIPSLMLMPLIEQHLLAALKAELPAIKLSVKFVKKGSHLHALIQINTQMKPMDSLALSKEQLNRFNLFTERATIFNTEYSDNFAMTQKTTGNTSQTTVQLLIH